MHYLSIDKILHAACKIENDASSRLLVGTLGKSLEFMGFKIGAGDVQVVEPPDAIKTVLVRWNSVKIDLNELALTHATSFLKLGAGACRFLFGQNSQCYDFTIHANKLC